MEAYTGFAAVYDTFMDNIPYAETATYVKRVKNAQTIYRNLYHLQ